MVMGKVLIMVRTSTEVQSIEDQHNEMLEFCKGEGFVEKDMVWVEEQGASAAKVDDTYRAMIDRVKGIVEKDPEIKCFAVWHLNRLARTEEVWVEVKSFFVNRQVQIIVKNPYLKLLTPDGKVDPGMELAAGLLALLAKQDQEERKEKFARAKRSMAKRGQYIGGNTVPYGYDTVGNEFLVKEEEARNVRLIFDLYSSGQYSGQTLAEELNQRGIQLNERQVVRIFGNKAYTGEPIGELGVHYPQIISRELFDRCTEIRQKNKLNLRQGSRVVLGSKLVRCYKCGAVCTCNSRHYVCCRAAHKLGCENRYALRKDVVDDLLWRTAFLCHMDYLLDLDGKKKKEYKKELKVVEQKIREAERKMEDFTKKKERIIESFLDLVIDKKTRDLRLSKLSDEVRVHTEQESRLKARKMALERILEGHSENTEETVLAAIEKMDTDTVFDIIHRHIEKVTGVPESFGERDPRCSRPNSVLITVTSVYGQDYLYRYFPKYYKGSNLYIFNGKAWVADYVTPVFHTAK